MRDLGLGAGLLSIVLFAMGLVMGSKEPDLRKKTLMLAFWLFVFGVVAGNGLLD